VTLECSVPPLPVHVFSAGRRTIRRTLSFTAGLLDEVAINQVVPIVSAVTVWLLDVVPGTVAIFASRVVHTAVGKPEIVPTESRFRTLKFVVPFNCRSVSGRCDWMMMPAYDVKTRMAIVADTPSALAVMVAGPAAGFARMKALSPRIVSIVTKSGPPLVH